MSSIYAGDRRRYSRVPQPLPSNPLRSSSETDNEVVRVRMTSDETGSGAREKGGDLYRKIDEKKRTDEETSP